MPTNLRTRLNERVQNLSESGNATMPETTLAPANTGYIALRSDALDIIAENLKNQPLSHALFDVIKSPSGGATAFMVPGLAGDEIARELTGIILDYTTPRAYWETPDPVEGTPPVCWSRDSLVSHNGEACIRCTYNDFGSKDGDSGAKACKESVEVFLLRPDNIMPIIVRVPVSSKLLFQRYMARLVGRLIPLSGVVTKITLERATNKTGQPYALYNFEAISVLSPEEAADTKAFGQMFMEILHAADGSAIQEAV